MDSTDSLIVVNDHLALHAIDERFVHDLHQLIVKNREWLQHFLDWPQYVRSVDQTRQTAQSNIILHQRGYAKMFLILEDNVLVGVLSLTPSSRPTKPAISVTGSIKTKRERGLSPPACRRLWHFTLVGVMSAVSSLNAGLRTRQATVSRCVTALSSKGVCGRRSS
jgi:RimJ/RimL family protein N-acetyltransferase